MLIHYWMQTQNFQHHLGVAKSSDQKIGYMKSLIY